MWGKAGKQCCGDCRSIVAGPLETAEPPEPAALFEAVWSAPEDMGPRRVLADALLEREDPRGRFLALELEGGPDAHEAALALLEAHGNAWYGPWFRHWDALVHEAGFPVEVRVDRAIRRTRSLRDAPIWPTVRRLVVVGGPPGEEAEGRLVRLLADPALAAVERVPGPS
ncbi:MAG: hypothetical protein H6734_05535 [Alphaproteobacteria bacterium]|nr:hypothetical protein [Alphaproteobacteria bacterium]